MQSSARLSTASSPVGTKERERIFGYTAEEVIGKPVTILIPEGHLDEEPTILARLRAGQRIEHYETVRMRKDGKLIDISLTVSPIKGPDGRIIGASKIARDITEQRQARRALDEASERFKLASMPRGWATGPGTQKQTS